MMVEVVEDVVAAQFGIEMHRGSFKNLPERMPLKVAEMHGVSEKIDEVGVGVVVGVRGYRLLAAIRPFVIAQGHDCLLSVPER
jgi:hypothetical protein